MVNKAAEEALKKAETDAQRTAAQKELEKIKRS